MIFPLFCLLFYAKSLFEEIVNKLFLCEGYLNFSWNSWRGKKPGPNFNALLTTKFCAYDCHCPLTVQAPNFCASCVHVSKECQVTLKNTNSLLTLEKYTWRKCRIPCFHKRRFFDYGKSRAMKLGPGMLLYWNVVIFYLAVFHQFYYGNVTKPRLERKSLVPFWLWYSDLWIINRCVGGKTELHP